MTSPGVTGGRPPGMLGVVYGAILSIMGALFALLTFAMASKAVAQGDREGLAISLVPGVITLICGAGLAWILAQRRKDKALAERRRLNPDEPWLWTDKWRDGRIRSNSSWAAAAVVTVFAVIWNAASWGAGLAVYLQGGLSREPGIVVFLLVFGVAGLALIAGAAYLVLLARKYPATVFEMSGVPGVLGGRLAGSIEIPPQVPAGIEARVNLKCWRASQRRGSSGSTSTTIWQDERTLTTTGGSLPVAFAIPYELPPSELPERFGMYDASPYSWTLSVAVPTAGVDYTADYSVPVFATEASDRTVATGVVEPAASAERPSHAKATLSESSAERTVFTLPPAKGLGCGLSAFLILPLAAWPIARLAGANVEIAAGACAVALLVGAGFLALSGVGVALMATSIEIDREAIRVPHGRKPVSWVRTIPIADVAEVRISPTENLRVDMLTRQGATYWISGEMSGPEEAKWLAAEVLRAVERHRGPTVAAV